MGGETPKSEKNQPGAFKLDHLQSTKSTFAKWISTLLTSHLQYFPFPASREMGIPLWTARVSGHRGCMNLGHSIGPFGIHETYFCNMDFHFIDQPHAAFPFSCIKANGHLTVDPKVSDTKGCMTLGLSNWTISSQQNLFLKIKFPLSSKPHAAFPFPAC